MRKIIFQMLVSVDGYFEGPNREIDWHNVDREFNDYAEDLLNSVDLLLFGRVTYELMAGYWTTPEAVLNDPIITGQMNRLQKIVFSRTLEKADWQNTRLISRDAAQEVSKLKSQPGKDIAVFGSSDLAVSLMGQDLIDEYRIIVNPVVLGRGKPLFKGIESRVKLKLLKARTFASGNVMLSYAPAR